MQDNKKRKKQLRPLKGKGAKQVIRKVTRYRYEQRSRDYRYKMSARKPRGLAPWMNRTFYYDLNLFCTFLP